MQEIENEDIKCSCNEQQEDTFMKGLFLEYKPEKDNLIQMLNEIQEHYRVCANGRTKRIVKFFINTYGRNLWSCNILF